MKSQFRKIIRYIHPEGIPWPGSVVYNALSRTGIFLEHYDLVARDIEGFGRPRRLLDIGTGPGRLLTALDRAMPVMPGAELVGIDISPAMVAQARCNVAEAVGRIQVRVAAADDLPFADSAFDCVVSTGSLHHWQDPGAALAEAFRVLRPGGHALLYDLVRDMPKGVAREVRRRFGTVRLALLWIHSFEEPFLNVDEMTALGEQSAFDVAGTRFVGALACLILKKGY